MTFWTAITVISLAAILSGLISDKHRHKAKDQKRASLVGDLTDRLAKIEDRLTNLESIIIEHDKEQRFKDL